MFHPAKGQVYVSVVLTVKQTAMIGSIQNFLTDKIYAETLAKDYGFELKQIKDTVIFTCKPSSEDDCFLKTDNGEIDLSDGSEFDIEFLRNQNATLFKIGTKVYSFGEKNTDAGLVLRMTEDQSDKLVEVCVNGKNLLNNYEDVDLYVETTEYGSTKLLELHGFVKNTNPDVRLQFDSRYPKVRVGTDLSESGRPAFFDLRGIKPREFSVSLPKSLNLTGDYKAPSLNHSQRNELEAIYETDTYTVKGFVKIDEDGIDVNGWNSREIQVNLSPDNYAPIQKSAMVDKPVTQIVFHKSEFEELTSLTIKYPDWVAGLSPSLEYDTTNLFRGSKYKNGSNVTPTEMHFDKVIPNTQFTVKHRASVFVFENLKAGEFSVEAGKDTEMCIPVVADSYSRIIFDATECSEECYITTGDNDKSFSLDNESTLKEISLSDGTGQVCITNGSGETIFDKTINRKGLLPITRFIITDDSVSIERSDDPVRTSQDYTYK